MKNKVLIGACAAAVLALGSACSDTFSPTSSLEGRILPNVGLDMVVSAPQGKAQGLAA
ncbi:MAG: hypothetical protein K2L78_04950 [Muribaculaceae bacterium]|nr:hypothetical protein [Muribaculaceae bacterium]